MAFRSARASLRRKPSRKKSALFLWLWWLFLFFTLFWFVSQSTSIKQPAPTASIRFYSSQMGQDLRLIIVDAIQKARQSVHLVMFGLSDPAVLQALAAKRISTKVYYDPSGCNNLWEALPYAQLYPIQQGGLMHQKILICDQETVFIGSANMTTPSLAMHDNLIIGLKSSSLAQFLIQKPPFSPGYFRTQVGEQQVELWLLPDPRGHALNDLRQKIRMAKTSLKIALFTFTHPALVEEILQAHKRGVFVMAIVDMHSASGASSKAVQLLRKKGVCVLVSKGVQLLHHKFILIDDQMLLTGSANWTKAAFYKNSDCFLILHKLSQEQKGFMKRLWQRLEGESDG